jgi:SAM-dependent methyltransferase
MGSHLRRLHWACGSVATPGWINSDIWPGKGIDLPCDIRNGLALADASIDVIVSHHGLNDLKIYEQVPALKELHRVLRPGGVVRMGLPDLDKLIAAYQANDPSMFCVWDWDTLAGNFITHMLWYNLTQTPFTYPFAEELFQKAGFKDVTRASYHETTTRYPDIVSLDSRPNESFFIEATK